MRLRVPLVAAFLLLGSATLQAAGTWYDHYLDAVDKHIPQRRWNEALQSLGQAI